MFHHLLEVCCPRWRSAGQVSTPHRGFAVVLRAVLEETAHTGRVHSSALSQEVMRTHTRSSPGFLSSALNSSAGSLTKLSSSNGFQAGCVVAFTSPPDPSPLPTALLWSGPASPISRRTGWEALASDGTDLIAEKPRCQDSAFKSDVGLWLTPAGMSPTAPGRRFH